jgi:uncharacterized peroxidase-related enzyme
MTAEYKMTLAPQTLDTAEGEARAVLDRALTEVGSIPNMYANMVNSPGLLRTYLDGYKAFRKDSQLTPAEQEVVFLTISKINGCGYCLAAHSMIADKVSKLDSQAVGAIRSGGQIADARLAALAAFTGRMVESRGLVTRADAERFLGAGYDERHILEIILAIAVKTLSNYSNHLFHTVIDDRFAAYA